MAPAFPKMRVWGKNDSGANFKKYIDDLSVRRNSLQTPVPWTFWRGPIAPGALGAE